MQIVGTLTLTSHAHQTAPDARDGNRNGTIKTNIFDQGGTRRQVPFITANSVRGLLRRAAATRVLDTLNQPVSRQLYHVLTRGAASRDDISAAPTVKGIAQGNQHVFAGLFGGGPYMLHSRYSIGPLLPMVAWCEHMLHPSLKPRAIAADQLRAKNHDTKTWFDVPLTTDIILTGKDDLLAGKGANHVADYQQSLQQWLEQVTQGRTAKADAKNAKSKAKKEGTKPDPEAAAGKSSDLSAFNFVEAMLPGTPLQFWLRMVKNPTKAQIGLALLSVQDWANANVLGGASARGFGRFNADLALYDGEHQVAANIFGMADTATGYTLSDEMAPYVDAAKAELEAITIEQLETVFPAKTAAKTGKAESKAKEA